MKPNLLCLCDSPTVHTGFGRVAQALLRRWKNRFERIDIFAINFDGDTQMPDSEWSAPKFRLLRARTPWHSTENLQRFLNLILGGDYTHVWIMQDLFLLSPGGFPGAFRQVCQRMGVRSLLYFPVDGSLEPEWTDMLRAVDVPVSYTMFGQREAIRKMLGRKQPADSTPDADALAALRPVNDCKRFPVLPHGVDRSAYRPSTEAVQETRRRLFGDWLTPEDILLVNVNQNSRRKAAWSSLALLASLREVAPSLPFRLLMHCPPVWDGIDLEAIGRQLQLRCGTDWCHTGARWTRGNVPQFSDTEIRDLYHAANLTISTSLGEGWGLSITESLASGCPIAAPQHTSCHEIMETVELTTSIDSAAGAPPCIGLPLGESIVVGESRVRRVIDHKESAKMLAHHFNSQHARARVTLPDSIVQWLDWDRIAQEWINLFNLQK